MCEFFEYNLLEELLVKNLEWKKKIKSLEREFLEENEILNRDETLSTEFDDKKLFLVLEANEMLKKQKLGYENRLQDLEKKVEAAYYTKAFWDRDREIEEIPESDLSVVEKARLKLEKKIGPRSQDFCASSALFFLPSLLIIFPLF